MWMASVRGEPAKMKMKRLSETDEAGFDGGERTSGARCPQIGSLFLVAIVMIASGLGMCVLALSRSPAVRVQAAEVEEASSSASVGPPRPGQPPAASRLPPPLYTTASPASSPPPSIPASPPPASNASPGPFSAWTSHQGFNCYTGP